jgi:hypothetical protein
MFTIMPRSWPTSRKLPATSHTLQTPGAAASPLAQAEASWRFHQVLDNAFSLTRLAAPLDMSSASCTYVSTLYSRSWSADCQRSIVCSAAAYQTLYHSLTQQGTGTWEGLTFQKQFARAFTVDSASVRCLPLLTLQRYSMTAEPSNVRVIQSAPALTLVASPTAGQACIPVHLHLERAAGASTEQPDLRRLLWEPGAVHGPGVGRHSLQPLFCWCGHG